MLLTIFNLFQTQQPQKISWAVWTGFGIAFVLGVSLLIYFIVRMRKTEKETEEEWSISKPSLFVAEPDEARVSIESEEPNSISGGEIPSIAAPASTSTVEASATTTLAIVAPEPVPNGQSSVAEPEPPPPESPHLEQTPAHELPQEREVTAAESQSSDETLPFDDDVWEALEAVEQGDTSAVLAGPPTTEPAGSARVESHASRETFVAGRREPFEPPAIEPLVSGERTVETDRESRREVNGGSARTAASANQPGAEREISMPSLANYGKEMEGASGHGGTIALVVVIVLVGGSMLAYFKSEAVHTRVDQLVARIRSAVQSEPPRSSADQTAGAAQPRAYVFPSRAPEVVKNIVKARGAVHNASDGALEGLSLEVTLERGDGAAPEIRGVPVKPDALGPQQRGTYEFEYDGKQFTGYRLTRLLSNGNEVKFASPGQK